MAAVSPAAAPAPASAAGPVPADPSGLPEPAARRADLIWAGSLTLALLLLLLLLNVSKTAAVPVLLALFLAYALDPVIDALEARGLSRTPAIVILFGVVLVGLGGFLLYLVPAIGSELAKVPGFLTAIADTALPRVESLIGQPLPDNVRDAAETLGRKGGGLAEKALPGLADFVFDAIGGTASVLMAAVGMLVIPVLLFYLLRDYDRIVAWGRSLLPRTSESLVAGRFAEVNQVISSFIRGQLIVGSILTVIYGTGLSLARIDLAVVIGATAGFGTMVPYVGPAIGASLALVSLAVSWQGPWQLVVVAATFALGMGLEGMYITPKVVGDRVGLPAVGVIVAVLVFGELFGFVGVLLAVPVTAALKVAGKVVIYRYMRSQAYRGKP